MGTLESWPSKGPAVPSKLDNRQPQTSDERSWHRWGLVLIQAEPTEMRGQALSHCGQGPSLSLPTRLTPLDDQPHQFHIPHVLPKSMPSPACVVSRVLPQ